MVTLDTLRALHNHDHKLALYCATCERWAVLDLDVDQRAGAEPSEAGRPGASDGDSGGVALTATAIIGLNTTRRSVHTTLGIAMLVWSNALTLLEQYILGGW